MGALASRSRVTAWRCWRTPPRPTERCYLDERAGSLGTAAAFSFYPSKNLGALGDAGAICTDDEQLAQSAAAGAISAGALTRSHGLPGYNERLDGLQAALMRRQAPAPRRVDSPAALDRGRVRRPSQIAEVELLEESPDSPCTYHLFPIRVDDRDALPAYLGGAEIATGVHYPSSPCPTSPPFAISRPIATAPIARDWAARELSLPIFPGMTDGEIDQVVPG